MRRSLLVAAATLAVLSPAMALTESPPSLLGLSYSQGASSSMAEPAAAAADEVGAVVVGRFLGSVDFDPGDRDLTLTSGHNWNTFVAGYSPAGEVQWVQGLIGLGNEPADVVVDASGNVIVVGKFFSSFKVGTGADAPELVAPGVSSDAYIVKLDRSGAPLWVAQGGRNGSYAASVAVSSAHSIWVSTRYRLLRLSDLGTISWQSEADFHAYAMEVGPDDSLYLTGRYAPGVDFDPGPGVKSLSTVGYLDAFVLRLTSGGDYMWVVSAGGSGQDQGSSLSVDSNGNVTIAGRFDGTADFDPDPSASAILTGPYASRFLWKLSPLGRFLWAQRLPIAGPFYVQASGWEDGSLLVGGGFRYGLDLGDCGERVSRGGTDAYFLLYGPDGALRSAADFGGFRDDTVSAVAISRDRLYVAGFFQSPSADLDPGEGEILVDPTGRSEMFLLAASFEPIPEIPTASPSGAVLLAVLLLLAGLRCSARRRSDRGPSGRRPGR